MLEEAESTVKERKGKGAAAAGSRGRKSEKEEDAELNDEEGEDDADAAFVFTESPACEWRSSVCDAVIHPSYQSSRAAKCATTKSRA
jgi:hypothetical protein